MQCVPSPKYYLWNFLKRFAMENPRLSGVLGCIVLKRLATKLSELMHASETLQGNECHRTKNKMADYRDVFQPHVHALTYNEKHNSCIENVLSLQKGNLSGLPLEPSVLHS